MQPDQRKKASADVDFFTEYGEGSRYRIEEVIGKGSYGVVCSAYDTYLGEKVAIKKINDIFEHVSDATRILREVKLLRLLRHPDIVEIKHILLPPSRREFKDIYVVFELMESDLHQVIKANDDLTPEHYQFFLYQLLRGLKYIHTANVFHRDLKPKNILANADCKLKICDFGLARVAFNDAPTAIFWTDYVATRWYRAPELCGSFFSKYTPAIDIWSIGCIFAELLTGKPLFPGKNVVHQLDLMTDLLGTPSPEAIARIRNEKARRYLSCMRKKKPIPFSYKFPNADPLALCLLERMLAFDPKDRPTAEEALADPYFRNLAKVEREPSAHPVTKMEFEFERRRITKEDVRDIIYREILEYHPKMLKEYVEGTEPTGFMYPSAVDKFKKQFAYLEEHYGQGGGVVAPPERQQASSLPRPSVLYSKNCGGQSPADVTNDLSKCSIKGGNPPMDRTSGIPMTRIPPQVPQAVHGGSGRAGRVVSSAARYNSCGTVTAAADATEQRRMGRNPAIPPQYAISYPRRNPNCKNDAKNLQNLEVQASGFEGPIPQNISVLTSLTELRISELNGGVSRFPNLTNMTGMRTLMLRRCNISGTIPNITSMTGLQQLDFSFNNLEGGIDGLQGLNFVHYMFLTNNSLSGKIPEWFLNRDNNVNIDLSYNNFERSSVPQDCRETVNLFKSYNGGESSEAGKCLKQCTKDWYSFHINCGGGNVLIGDTTYEADEESRGFAKFVSNRENWVTSSTGNFWDKNKTVEAFTTTNISVIKGNDYEIYKTARLSPLSMTYYGRCLANGNYTVKLHFAEIVLRDNRSFQSLGKRMFDVYIQGERKLKDFDIKAEAQGVDKALVKQFQAVVRDKTLEVRFEYAGKGTTAVPSKGTYGPLISAISVESDFKPPKKRKTLIIVVAVASSLFLIFMILCFTWWKIYIRKNTSQESELQGLDLQTDLFTLAQIKAATNNFDAANKIGEGGFGPVYKGTLLDGTVIAVKQLSSNSSQGYREFLNEIGMISCLQHPNLVKLYGCCVEGKQLLLVYEYLENNSLANALFGPEECQLKIDWPTRQKICVGIAKGLAFLHEESAIKIVHKDIKATNVLLDKELNPKVSDFGLAKLDDDANTHISTRVAGTKGYMAPEYALWGYLTFKADIYSFGVVALEIVAGKSNVKYRHDENCVCLLDWAHDLQKKGNLLELIDPRLGSNFDEEQALRMIKVALLCTNSSPVLRPSMSAVINMLEGHDDILEYNTDLHEFNFQAMKDRYNEMPPNSSNSPYNVDFCPYTN